MQDPAAAEAVVADAAAVGEAAARGTVEFGERGALEGDGVGGVAAGGDGDRVGADQRVLAHPAAAEGATVGEASGDARGPSPGPQPGQRGPFGGGDVEVAVAGAEGQPHRSLQRRRTARGAAVFGHRDAVAEGRIAAVVERQAHHRVACLRGDVEGAPTSGDDPGRGLEDVFRRGRAGGPDGAFVGDATVEAQAAGPADGEGADDIAAESARVEVTAVG